MINGLIEKVEPKYEEYLADESKLAGWAESISFPQSMEEISSIVREMAQSGTPVTLQGGKTGICGGAVPFGGHVLNLSRLNRITGLRKDGAGYLLTAQAGVLLSELEQRLHDLRFDTQEWDDESRAALAQLRKEEPHFWPVEPTETSATVGGVLATNAKGVCAPFYGDCKAYTDKIIAIDGCGYVLAGEAVATYIGSEGITGIIAEATLRLIPRLREQWGLTFFFEEKSDLFAFADGLLSLCTHKTVIAAMEYIDRTTLRHIAELKKAASKLKGLPDIGDSYCGLIYVELHSQNEETIEEAAADLMELAAQHKCADESIWAVSGYYEMEKLRALRHAAPESINIAVEQNHRKDTRITKLSTDLEMQGTFGDVIRQYERDAQINGIEVAIFGHLGSNHVHANLIAADYAQYETGERLIEQWTREAACEDGALLREHGIGKLKKKMLRTARGATEIEQMTEMKRKHDPCGILNKGTVFDLEL